MRAMRIFCLGILLQFGIITNTINKTSFGQFLTAKYRLKRNIYMSCQNLTEAWNNSTFINVTPLEFNSSIDVTFRSANRSFPFLWYKVCLVNDPHVNCSITNVISSKTIDSKEISPNAIINVNFNATRGNYCAFVQTKPSKPKYCFLNIKGHTVELKGDFSNPTAIIRVKESVHNNDSIIALIIMTVVVTSVTVIILLRFRRINATEDDLKNLEGNSAFNDIDHKTILRVFLLHCFGDEKTDELVYSFEKILEECFNCTVVHCKTTAGINGIITQTQGVWTLNNIRNSDKIIVVESDLACHLQETLINNECVEIENNDEQVFLCGLITILNFNKISTNYNLISVVRFHHFHLDKKLDGIVENSRFILPESLPDLYHHLKETPICRTSSSVRLVEYWKENSTAFNEFTSMCDLEKKIAV